MAAERGPRWLKIGVYDWDGPCGQFMLADGSQRAWADYGRWVALRQMLMTSPGSLIRADDERRLGALARKLGFKGKRPLLEWLAALAECGAISASDWAEGSVCDPDVAAQSDAYWRQSEANAKNRSKGAGSADESKRNR